MIIAICILAYFAIALPFASLVGRGLRRANSDLPVAPVEPVCELVEAGR